jgi:hypothetical protein
MKAPFRSTVLLALCLSPGLRAEETAAPAATPAPKPAAEPKPATEEMIRARLLEHTKLKAAAKSAAQATPSPAPAPIEKSPVAIAATAPAAAPEKMDAAKTQAQPAAVLPRVEVSKPRITILEHQLQEQEREIDREKKLTKSTDLDKALNGPAMNVSILGGESTKYRTTVASERVSLMESEKDIIEAIAHAKTKEEKAELQKELVEIKAMRRDLEKALR